MKLMHIAIASIVGVNQDHESAGHVVELDTAPRRSRRGFQGSGFRVITAYARSLAARVRARLAERAALQALDRLDDRALRDIGLYRGDLDAVRMGATTLAALDAERRPRRAATPAAVLPIHGERHDAEPRDVAGQVIARSA